MTISSSYSPDTYAGNGSLTTFSITFEFLSVAGNVKVSLKDDTTNVITLQTNPTHYSISGTTVTFVTAPATGKTVIIELDPDFTQDSDYSENDTFPAETLERDLDERTLEGQINKDNNDRTLKLDASLSGVTSTIVASSTNLDNANKTLAFNSTGTGIEALTAEALGTITIPVPVTKGGTNATDAATALANLGGVDLTSAATLTNKTIDADNNTLTNIGSSEVKSDLITGQSSATVASGDLVMVADIDDSNNLKQVTAGSIAALSSGGNSWSDAVDADIVPDADGTRDLGSSANRFAETHTDLLDIAGTTNVTAILDEDNMASDSATALATQQSIKAYVDANGGGAWTLISSATASSSASIEFTGLSSSYQAYVVVFSDVTPATDNVEMWVRTSTNNGSSYDNGAADYSWAGARIVAGYAIVSDSDTADSEIQVSGPSGSNLGLGTGTGEYANGDIMLVKPSSAKYKSVIFRTSYKNSVAAMTMFQGSGIRETEADVDAIQILMSSGNIASGEFRLYGVTNA